MQIYFIICTNLYTQQHCGEEEYSDDTNRVHHQIQCVLFHNRFYYLYYTFLGGGHSFHSVGRTFRGSFVNLAQKYYIKLSKHGS